MTGGWTVAEAGDGPVEVVIGMHWHQLWRLAARPWVPLAFARMLAPQPDAGLRRTRVAVRPAGPAVVQEWASRRAVDAWARDPEHAHVGPWARFRSEASATASWGVWHEVGPARRRT